MVEAEFRSNMDHMFVERADLVLDHIQVLKNKIQEISIRHNTILLLMHLE